jgi:hypothetical protein
MKFLEVEEGEDINYPFYLSSDVFSKKQLVRGAYTIENEEEVFIDKPVSEKNIEKELVKRMESLRDLRKEVEELKELKKELEKEVKEKDKLQEREKKL